MHYFTAYINVITTGETSEQSQYDVLKCNFKKERKSIIRGHASVPLFSAELQERGCHTVKQTPLTQHPIRSQADTA
jgi:hypothetical protein